MNTHLKQLWAAMKLPKNFKKSYKFFCLGLDIRVPETMHTNAMFMSETGKSLYPAGSRVEVEMRIL